MKYGTPKMAIVEAMMTYGEAATQYIPLMEQTLRDATTVATIDHELRITLKERIKHFKKEYAEEVEQPEI